MTDRTSDNPPKSEPKIPIDRGIPSTSGPSAWSDGDVKRRPVYVGHKKRRIPPWTVAIAVFALLMVGLFVILPRLIDRDPRVVVPDPSGVERPSHRVPPADENAAVVTVASTPVFASPDPRSERRAEALFNERVDIIDARDRIFLGVRLSDGVRGYIRREAASADTRSVSPEGTVARVIVRTASKRVMSDARRGYVMVEAPMGSVMYADYRRGDLLRLRLPKGETGWINVSGVLILPPEASVVPEDDAAASFASTLMAFVDCPWVPGGATVRGISPEGALHVAGRLHGLSLPRDRAALMRMGEDIRASEAREGDVYYFHRPGDRTRVDAVGMRVADNQLLMATFDQTTLHVIDLDSETYEARAALLLSVKRYIP